MMSCMLKSPQLIIILAELLDWDMPNDRRAMKRVHFQLKFLSWLCAYNPLTGTLLNNNLKERDFICTYLGNKIAIKKHNNLITKLIILNICIFFKIKTMNEVL